MRTEPKYLKRDDLKIFALLVIIPVATLAWSFLLRSMHGPYFSAFYADPEYMYLLNALNMLNLVPPDHFDNPGTTVQSLSALAILGKWTVSSISGASENLQLSVIKNPESYLEIINIVINLMLSAAIFFSGIVTYRCRQMLIPALIMQITPLLYFQTHIAISRVSPEPLLFIATVLLGTALIPVLTCNDSPNHIREKWSTIAAGIFFGFGLATKVTFAPLLGTVLLFQGTRKKLIFIAIGCLSFVVFTLPIITHYPKMFSWFYSIASHQGSYGSGSVGLPSLATYFKNLKNLFIGEPFLFIQTACYLIVLLPISKAQAASSDIIRLKRLLATGLLITSIQILLSAKNPSGLFSGTHYALPAMVFSAFINSYMIYCLACTKRSEFRFKKFIVIASLFLGGILVSYKLNTWIDRTNSYRKDLERVKLLTTDKKVIAIPYYGAPNVQYALSLGNDFAGYRYGEDLKKVYPNLIFYELFKKVFYSYGDFVSLLYLRSYYMRGWEVLIYGFPLFNATEENNMKLEPVFVTDKIGTYRITSFPN